MNRGKVVLAPRDAVGATALVFRQNKRRIAPKDRGIAASFGVFALTLAAACLARPAALAAEPVPPAERSVAAKPGAGNTVAESADVITDVAKSSVATKSGAAGVPRRPSGEPNPPATAAEKSGAGNIAPEAGFADEPFDVGTKTIPTGYPGVDITELVRELETEPFSTESVDYPRDSPEYAQWLDRRGKTLRDRPLYGGLTFGSRFACVIPNASETDDLNLETVTARYAPATRTMTVERGALLPQDDLFAWAPGSFPPCAAYFSVCRKDGRVYAMEILSSQFRKREPPTLRRWTIVNVEPEDYERYKDSVRVLCVFKLGVGGNFFLGVYSPTRRRSPGALLKVDDRSKALPFALLSVDEPEFWIYDAVSGRILAKYSAADALNGRRVAAFNVPDDSVADRSASRAPDREPPLGVRDPFMPHRFEPAPPPPRFPGPPPRPPRRPFPPRW